jgi:hypothetical protein
MTSQADGTTDSAKPDLAAASSAALRSALASGHQALYVDGDLLVSRDSFDSAYRLAELTGEVGAMAQAAIGLGGLWVSEQRTLVGAAQLEERLQHVLSLLDPHSSLALRIRARLAGEADYLAGGHLRILAVLDEARTTADPVALADALSLAHHCLLGPDHVSLRRELATELIKVSFRTGRRSDRLMGLMWQTIDAYSAGDSHAGRVLGELRTQLSEHDHPAVGFIVSALEVLLAIRAGQLDQAELLVAACARRGASAGDIDSEWWPGAQLVAIRWYQGRLAELLPMLRQAVDSPALSAVDNSAVAALAVAAALAGDRSAAASCLATLHGGDLGALPRSSSWLVTMNAVVEAAFLLGEAEIAREAYELLRPYDGLPMVGGLGVICLGSVEQALGTAALTAGELDLAVSHLRAATRCNLALAHWPAVVSSRRRLTQALAQRGRPADAEEAERERAAAENDARAHGLPVPDEPRGGHAGSVLTCQREGRRWRLVLGDRHLLVDDSIGMLHLAVLIASPRRDISAADLVAGLARLSGASGADLAGPASVPSASQPQAVLDATAISDYRDRLRALDEQLELASGIAGDSGLEITERATQERDWLIAQLASATGLRGRARSFSDEGERARVTVGKAIRRALTRIGDADPIIGAHLRQSVHTGTHCSYWPA